MEKVAKAVLRYLFQEYKKAPTVLYSINTVTAFYKTDALTVANFLVDKKWIREEWINQNEVTCRISVEGIQIVNALFIHNKITNLVAGLAEGGGSRELMTIFQNNIEEYAIALDIVYHMEKMGLVSIIHNQGRVDVELTSSGWTFSESGGKALLVLMSVA